MSDTKTAKTKHSFWRATPEKMYTTKELNKILADEKRKSLEQFDFSQLWAEPTEESGGLMKILPVVGVVFSVVIIIILLAKK